MKFYSFCKKLLRNTLLKIWRVEIINPENEPDTGALVCANHISNIDPVVICACLNNQVRFMAKKELFKIPILRSMLKSFGAFPVHRGSVDMTAMKTAIKHLADKKFVGMFPQGTRCRSVHPKDTAVKNGVGMILSRVEADVLPVAIITKDYKFKFGCKVYVVIGNVIPAQRLTTDGKNREEFERISKFVFDEILKLHSEYSYLLEDGEKH